jgi:hypothetical protein
MIVHLAGSVGEDVEAEIIAEWSEIAPVDRVDRMYMLSIGPPEFLAIAAEYQVWANAIGAAVGLFFAELTKEAAKATWRNKAAIARVLGSAAMWPLRQAAEVLHGARGKLARGAQVGIRINVGYEIQIRVALEGDVEMIAADLAAIVRSGEELARVASEIEHGPLSAGGQYFAEIAADGRVTLNWISSEPMRRQSRIVGMPIDGGV